MENSNSNNNTQMRTQNETNTSCEFFDEDEYLNRLDSLKTSKHAIESLANLMTLHKASNETIAQLWFEKLNDVLHNDERTLALFYLVHEVIKNCKIKNAEVYKDSFRKYLIDSFALVKNFNRSELIKKQLHQVLDSWSERFIYEKDFISKLNETLVNKPNEVTNNAQTSEMSSLLPFRSAPSNSRQSVDSGISTSHLSTTNDEDIICLTPSAAITMPKVCLKINPMQIISSNDPNCAMMKNEMEQFMRINNEILYRRGQFEQITQETKIKEASKKLEYEIKFKEQQLEFKKRLEDIAISEAKHGKIDTALKIYSVINNASSGDKNEVSEKELRDLSKDVVVTKKENAESGEEKVDPNRYRHLISVKNLTKADYDRIKITHWSKCIRSKEKMCPKGEHYHYLVDSAEYKCHLSSYFRKKQSGDYYKSYHLKDSSDCEYIINRFKMKPNTFKDDDDEDDNEDDE